MGIRIHKMCGWGLGQLAQDDPRINWESWFFKGYKTEEKFAAYEAFVKEKNATEAHILRTFNEDKTYLFSNSLEFTWSEDEEQEEVFCVRPLWCTDWHRSDSMLDWLECPDEEHLAVKTQWLRQGIFPWNSRYMDARTGKEVPSDSIDFIRVLWRIEEAGFMEDLLHETLLEPLGLTFEEAQKVIVPVIPEDIRNLCEYTEIFTEPNTINTLRPLVLTWWV